MLKQNQMQRQSINSKKHSVTKKKKVVMYRPSRPKTSLLPPSSRSTSTSSLYSGPSLAVPSFSLFPTPPVADEEYDSTTQLPMDFLRSLLQSPSNLTLDMDEEEDGTVYVDRRSYAEKTDFFDNFKELTDIEHISEDVSAADIVEAVDAKVKQLRKDIPEDEGIFVDPLTGLRISSVAEQKITQTEKLSAVKPKTSKSKPKSKTTPETKPEPETRTTLELQLSDLMIPESQMLGSQAFELNELILPDDKAFSEVSIQEAIGHTKEMIETPGDMLETFLELVDIQYEDHDIDKGIDWSAMARERETRIVQQQTNEFLTALIRKVVEHSEFRTKEEVLADKLDKRKLLVEFAEKCIRYEAEVTYKRILERKVVDILRRKRLISQITPSKLDSVSEPKYVASLWEIEKQLARESAIRKKFENTKRTLQAEIRESEKKSKKQIQAFETLVKLKLSGGDLENLNHRILPYIAEMNEFRKKISATRYKLILLEGTQAELQNKLAEIKDIGGGFSLEDYYNLHNNNQTLQKKIEERDGNLNKLHFNLQKNIHILAHYAETKLRFNQSVQRQRSELKELQFEQNRLRRHLQNLNLKRLRTRQEIKEMSFKAGLLDKPLLMYDYDQTVEQLEEDKKRIAHLRATLVTIEHKIKILEERLSNRSVISYTIR